MMIDKDASLDAVRSVVTFLDTMYKSCSKRVYNNVCMAHHGRVYSGLFKNVAAQPVSFCMSSKRTRSIVRNKKTTSSTTP